MAQGLKEENKKLGIIFDLIETIIFVQIKKSSYRGLNNQILFNYEEIYVPL